MSGDIISKPNYKLTLNGKYREFPDDAGGILPLAVDAGRTLIPLRGVFEEIGAKVLWVWVNKGAGTGDIIITKENKVIRLKLDDQNATVWENVPAGIMSRTWDEIPPGTRNIELDVLKAWQTEAAVLKGKTMTLDAAPRMLKNKTYIPVRFVGEALGARVGWDQDTDTPGTVHVKDYNFGDQRFLIFYDAAENELKKLILEKNGEKEVFEFSSENRYADYKIGKPDLKNLLALTKGHINIVIYIREANFDIMCGRHGNGRHRSLILNSWETSKIIAQGGDIDAQGRVITFPLTYYNVAGWETHYGTNQSSVNIWDKHRDFVKNELVARTVNIIKNIIEARNETERCEMPGIYIGTPHFGEIKSYVDPKTKVANHNRYINEYMDLLREAYNEIIGAIGRDNITGIYFGNEDPGGNIVNDNGQVKDLKLSLMRKIRDFAHSNGLLYLWAPYGWFSGKSKDAEDAKIYGAYGEHDKKVFNLDCDSEFNYTRYICKIINRSIFDIIIMQPAHFYEANKPGSFLAHIVDLATREGLGTCLIPEFEFDLSLITGRGNKSYILSSQEKTSRFTVYLEQFEKLRGSGGKWKTPIGIYAGGPNEFGFRNTGANANHHSNANHFPYMPGEDELIEFHKMTYDKFLPAKGFRPYAGNLVYDILNGILNDDWKPELVNYLKA